MKVLVTGGVGYIGSKLIQKLSEEKQIDEIVIYDNLSLGNYGLFFNKLVKQQAKITFVQGDILDSRKIKRSLTGIDTVVHLAAKVTTPFSERGSDYFEQVNHWGSAELAYAIEESEVKRAIYMSSASVYGAQANPASIETIPTPNTAYGFSKLRGEAHFERLKDDLDIKIIRCANTYGYSPSMRLYSVINKFVFKSQHKQIININGNGNQTRAFVPISEVIDNLNQAILSKEMGFQKYNLAKRNLSINQIIRHLQLLYPSLEMIYVNQHLSLRNQVIEVQDDQNNNEINESFLKELENLKSHFAF